MDSIIAARIPSSLMTDEYRDGLEKLDGWTRPDGRLCHPSAQLPKPEKTTASPP
jgi:hypothetical protein